MRTELNGWQISTSDDGQYIYLQRDGAPGQIHVKAEDEGFVVDIFSDDDTPECLVSTFASYQELEPE